jgi:hypothetical protein
VVATEPVVAIWLDGNRQAEGIASDCSVVHLQDDLERSNVPGILQVGVREDLLAARVDGVKPARVRLKNKRRPAVRCLHGEDHQLVLLDGEVLAILQLPCRVRRRERKFVQTCPSMSVAKLRTR